MAFKPFKWIKKHPLEAAAIAAGIYFGGPMVLGALEGGAGAAAGAGAAGAAGAEGAAAGLVGGTLGAEFGGMTAAQAAAAGFGGGGTASLLAPFAGTMASNVAGGLTNVFGPSEFTAALAGDAYMPAALGPAGTGTPGWGSLMGSAFNSPTMSPQNAMRMSQMMGGGGQPQQQPRPLGAPPEVIHPYQRSAMSSQNEITKKWLLQNDPATYARLYGQAGVV